jgi:UDP-glucose 4-epimerase
MLAAMTRAFSYIDDVAPVIAASIARPQAYNQVFNVGADKPYTVAELAQVVSRAMGVEPDIKHLAARNEVVHAYSAHEKVHRHFGDLIKNVTLTEGVAKMAVWARKTGARQGQPFQGIEVRKNLPKSWAALEKNP